MFIYQRDGLTVVISSPMLTIIYTNPFITQFVTPSEAEHFDRLVKFHRLETVAEDSLAHDWFHPALGSKRDKELFYPWTALGTKQAAHRHFMVPFAYQYNPMQYIFSFLLDLTRLSAVGYFINFTKDDYLQIVNQYRVPIFYADIRQSIEKINRAGLHIAIDCERRHRYAGDEDQLRFLAEKRLMLENQIGVDDPDKNVFKEFLDTASDLFPGSEFTSMAKNIDQFSLRTQVDYMRHSYSRRRHFNSIFDVLNPYRYIEFGRELKFKNKHIALVALLGLAYRILMEKDEPVSLTFLLMGLCLYTLMPNVAEQETSSTVNRFKLFGKGHAPSAPQRDTRQQSHYAKTLASKNRVLPMFRRTPANADAIREMQIESPWVTQKKCDRITRVVDDYMVALARVDRMLYGSIISSGILDATSDIYYPLACLLMVDEKRFNELMSIGDLAVWLAKTKTPQCEHKFKMMIEILIAANLFSRENLIGYFHADHQHDDFVGVARYLFSCHCLTNENFTLLVNGDQRFKVLEWIHSLVDNNKFKEYVPRFLKSDMTLDDMMALNKKICDMWNERRSGEERWSAVEEALPVKPRAISRVNRR